MAAVTTTQRVRLTRLVRPTRYSREEADRRLLLCALLIARKQRALCRVVGADPGGFDIHQVGRLIAGLGRLHRRHAALAEGIEIADGCAGAAGTHHAHLYQLSRHSTAQTSTSCTTPIKRATRSTDQ